MKRYILTGTSGAGKTSIIRFLENMGHCVIHEAATDIIASEQASGIIKPWDDISFIDKIVDLQKQRQLQASGELQFFDRVAFDTYALSMYLDYAPSITLLEEIKRINEEKTYEKKVFFIENLGFCKKTPIRQISYEEALRFEKIHEEVYKSYGYELVRIVPQQIEQRVNKIVNLVAGC